MLARFTPSACPSLVAVGGKLRAAVHAVPAESTGRWTRSPVPLRKTRAGSRMV